ncbi:MAG: GWxTD domain-containing protein, partial [Acidobacteriota bacterium]
MNAANKAYSCLAVFVLSLMPFTARADSTKVSAKYQKWLEEDVACVITSVERDVFSKLQTDRERDSFIEAFWKHRDPTPGTPENEFKTEHYRRLAYANQYLGRDAVGPGSRTDRGRMYILLGEPQDIERFNGIGIYQAEAWFYQGKTDLGLPAGFYLLFFKRRGQGVLKLYSPFADGPQALMTGYDGDPTNYSKALSALKNIEPELATVSISLVPGEESSVSGQPSMASDLLIQNIDAVPSRIVQSQYARKFLEYKDLVDVEYTANYIDNSSLIKVFKEPATGMHFVHYAV